MADLQARIEVLAQELDAAQARIRELEQLLGINLPAPLCLGLTGREQRLFGALMARDFLSKEAAMTAIYDPAAGDAPYIKIIDVFICKIRRKIKAFGIGIETIWGFGYRIPAADKGIVRDLISRSADAA